MCKAINKLVFNRFQSQSAPNDILIPKSYMAHSLYSFFLRFQFCFFYFRFCIAKFWIMSMYGKYCFMIPHEIECGPYFIYRLNSDASIFISQYKWKWKRLFFFVCVDSKSNEWMFMLIAISLEWIGNLINKMHLANWNNHICKSIIGWKYIL